MTGRASSKRATPPKVALTGFLPFLDVPINPSALLVTSMRDDPGWAQAAGVDASFTLLDTVYSGLRGQIESMLANRPAALILTGFSRRTPGLRIETRATSLCSPDQPDASGWRPPSTREPLQEYSNSGVDFPALAEDLRAAGIGCDLSEDAGEYVCNHSYFHALDLIAREGLETRALFVHLPAVENMPQAPESAGQMPLTEMQRAMALFARALAGAPPTP